MCKHRDSVYNAGCSLSDQLHTLRSKLPLCGSFVYWHSQILAPFQCPGWTSDEILAYPAVTVTKYQHLI